jgi:hypothetical protein
MVSLNRQPSDHRLQAADALRAEGERCASLIISRIILCTNKSLEMDFAGSDR